MSKEQEEQVPSITADDAAAPEPDVVAAAAARLLVEAARAVDAAPVAPGNGTAHARRPEAAAPEGPTSALRHDPAIAEIHEEIASVQSELSEVSSGVIGLQAHGLRQTGIAALVLAVLIAIAWKVIGG